MKLTKYGHACFSLESENQTIVVDPGEDSTDLLITDTVAAVFVTHHHSDHLDPQLIAAIARKSPNVVVYGSREVVRLVKAIARCNIIDTVDTIVIDTFTVRPFMFHHGFVHPELGTIQNIGYFINNVVYYGGDSVEVPPDISPQVLAVPMAANWARFSDVIDFVRTLKPELALATHDRQLSETGKRIADAHVTNLTRDYGVRFVRLSSGETLAI